MNSFEEGYRMRKKSGSPLSVVFADLDLARRLEAAEAQASASFIDARARYDPGSGACRIEVAGAMALFDGPASPLTQTFGLGLAGPVSPADLTAIEGFYRQRGAPVFHEVCPLAGPELSALLVERGYCPVEFTSMLYRPLRVTRERRPAGPASGLRARLIEPGEEDRWASVAARGWSDEPALSQLVMELGRILARRSDGFCFVAEWDGMPVATGALSIHAGVALLAGAATVPEARRRGAQLALLEARLNLAAERGCDLAMMGAQPGSASQRNAERHGFRIAYTRIKWGKE